MCVCAQEGAGSAVAHVWYKGVWQVVVGEGELQVVVWQQGSARVEACRLGGGKGSQVG